jgi:release factor glutamine methyltransferase
VRLVEGDLFAPIERDARYLLIASNPPYIPARELATLPPDVRCHEPRLALAGGEDGFAVHDRIAREAGAFLAPGGALLVEVGAGQAPALEQRLASEGWVEATARHRDLGGIERVVEARRR